MPHWATADEFRARKLGLAGVCVPEEYGGGRAVKSNSHSLLIDEISCTCATPVVVLAVNNSQCCNPLLKFGSEEQKKELTRPSNPQLRCGECPQAGLSRARDVVLLEERAREGRTIIESLEVSAVVA